MRKLVLIGIALSRLASEPRNHHARNARSAQYSLVLHGGFHAAWCWEEYFLPRFCAHGFDVHACSLRGQGASEGRVELVIWDWLKSENGGMNSPLQLDNLDALSSPWLYVYHPRAVNNYDFPFLERMPRGVDFFDDAQSPPTHKDTGATAIHDFLKIAFPMRPTKLATLLRHLQVHMPTIAAQDAVDFLTQQGRQAEGTAFGMDDEDGDVGHRRRPQPTQLTPELPARLVGKPHRRSPHRGQGLLMSGRQGSADFLFEIGHSDQGNGCAKNDVGNFLDAAFTDAVTAREVRQRAGQAWPDAVGANRGRYRRVGHDATARTGAAVSLRFGNLHRDRRQFDSLEAFGLWVVRPGLRRQRGMAACALVGHEVLDTCDPLGRQQLLEVRRMVRLSAAATFGLFLMNGFVGAEGLADGGVEELVALVLSLASSSATRRRSS
jgi:hypothetical protein